jgi:hypothetical protein
MSETEFELYLSLLGRFLRLKPQQRDQIAAELRDHLDARLEDLQAAGLPREEAIRRALDEFGDAASLAEHFSRLTQVRRRRLIMRCTLGTIAASAAAIFLAMAFWPAVPGSSLPERSVAKDTNKAEPRVAAVSEVQARRAKVEQALDSKTIAPGFNNMPFTDVLQFLSSELDVDIVTAGNLEASASPITLSLKNPVSARTVLELILEKAGNSPGYIIRDGLIYITIEEQVIHEVAVYNCRDLLAEIVPNAPESKPVAVPATNDPMFLGFGSPAGIRLIQVIEGAIQPTTWINVGGAGSIREINGLLVVEHTQSVHRQVQKLLDMLRAEKK